MPPHKYHMKRGVTILLLSNKVSRRHVQDVKGPDLYNIYKCSATLLSSNLTAGGPLGVVRRDTPYATFQYTVHRQLQCRLDGRIGLHRPQCYCNSAT